MSTGERWRLGHRPALDGLRGIAVLLVVAAHAVPTWFPAAGSAGVTVFFVLSGFLITSLLLDELDDAGRISLRAFYRRRAARLFPALAVFVAVVVVLQVAVAGNFGDPPDALWVALYVGNWLPAMGETMGGLDHTWSLAVEEQFYLLFPLLVVSLAARSRRWFVTTVVVLAVASASLRVGLLATGAPVDRVYNGTDTVACLLLAGCLTAFAVRRWRFAARPWLALCLLGAIGVGATVLDEATGARSLFPLAVAPMTAVALVSLLESSALTAPWLVLIGKRSYGLYLWHFPLLMIVGEALDIGGGIPRHVTALPLVAASWGLTCLSWRFVEQPFMRRKVTKEPEQVASIP